MPKIIIYSFIAYIYLIYNENLILDYIYFSFTDSLIYLGNFSGIFTIICFIVALNILNLIDGIDGLLISFSISILIILLIYNFNYFCFILMCILIFLLILNIKKIIFLGNSGASILSVILSVLIIPMANENPYYFSIEKILIMFFLPLLDALRLFIERVFKNKSPFQRDVNHFHHLVLKKLKKEFGFLYY